MPVLNVLFIGLATYRLKKLQALYALPSLYTKTAVYWVKVTLASAIAAAPVLKLLFTASTQPLWGIFDVFTVGLLFQSTAYVGALRLHHYEHTRMRKSSDILLLYWLFTIVVSLVTLRTDLATRYTLFETYSAVRMMRYTMLALTFALFSAELMPRKMSEYVLAEDDDDDMTSTSRFGVRAPMEDANIFSLLTFSWMSPLLKLSQSKQITEDDLWEVPSHIAPVDVAETFDVHWQHELDHHLHCTPSLWRALWRTTGTHIVIGGFFKLIHDSFSLLNPVLLSLLLEFVASHTSASPQPMSHGYFYASCMLGLQIIQTIVFQRSVQIDMDTKLKINTSLTTALYKKSIRLSNESRQEYTTGAVAMLFWTDVARVGGVIDYIYTVWSAPLQVVIVIYMLFNTLGYSVFVGVAIMAASVPLNNHVSKRLFTAIDELTKNQAKRASLIVEVLSGIRAIKLYAWEHPFVRKIQHVRESLELVSLSKYGQTLAWFSISSTAVPFLVSFTTFLIYSLFDNESHGPLTARLVFVSLSLFGLLRSPLVTFPTAISVIANAKISMNRIHKLLTSDELDLESVTRLERVRQSNHRSPVQGSSGSNNNGFAVQVTDGSFCWLSKEVAILDNINFSALSSEHLAIVGRVGSGKSSLLSALLGDMRKEKGNVVLCGQVAYVPQQPWIMNATLRSNVLFGLKYDETFYNRVIDACALRPDLEMLTAGDLTEIGEKGINLSGGQKARVSLARAVYARADIYILDDPLSAVDAHVARHLFDHVLGPEGLLKSRCRIHATNAIQFIGKFDSVLMLQDGLVAEYGAVGDLMEKGGLVHSLIQEYGVAESDSLDTLSPDSPPGSTGFLILSNVWLKFWSSANEIHERDGTPERHGVLYYFAVYGTLGLVSSVLSYSQSIVLWSMCAVGSGRTTHRNMLDAVFRSPVRFFDTTPLGRIQHRFSGDQFSVDEAIPRTFAAWFQGIITVIQSLAVIVLSIPAFSLVIAPVAISFFYLKNYFLDTSRTLKRLDSIVRAPVYSGFIETLSGVSTIRAFGKSDKFMAKQLKMITAGSRCAYLTMSLNCWLSVRLEFMSAFIVFATAMLGVISLLYGRMDAGLVGLSLSYALQNTQQIGALLKVEGELENKMCDFVRVQEYAKLTPEAPDVIEDNRTARSWPEQGMVEFKNYSTRYREGLDFVLKDVSFSVRPHEKVGIVGRTGAGKSSLTLALFRIIEAAEGQILLDGEDIAQYGLFDVRSKLSIIPQDPVLFAGTVRENLDPFNTYSDQDIWCALEHACLADFIRTKDERLEFVVMQGGENFSVGQRQLICLARALLKHAKVLVLDEATAAIDPESDAIIQNSIRKEFKDCTVLTIAHRLNTIIDSDRILVLDQGQVAEFDTPNALLAKEGGLFKWLWARANES
ncbi:hypothetical protein H4S04_005414 [Coemansia sp. S16]|nr:hypothetical protein H4S04_005414 [Coemansia sp. S16]